MSGLKARIASAEARARILSPGLRIVTIEGGLRDGVADVAEYGDEIIHRREGESVELFRARAVEEATVFGARLVVLGGLPDMPMTSAMRDVLVPHSQWGRWQVLGPHTERSGAGQRYVACQCRCGTVKPVRADSLRAGTSRSCGCLREELLRRPRRSKPWSAARRAAYDLFHEHRRRAHARAFAFGEAKPASPSIPRV